MKNDPIDGFSITNGKFVQTGTDKYGNPLYQSIEAATDTLSTFSEAHAAQRGSVGKDTGRSNVGCVFAEVRASVNFPS